MSNEEQLEYLENELAEMERKKQQLLSRVGNIEYNKQIIEEQLEELRNN